MNNPRPVKIYTTIKLTDDQYITKISDRMSPEELGPEFSGMDQKDQTVGADIGNSNQPQDIDATIPPNSFLNHDTLASKQANYNRITGEWEPEEWGKYYNDFQFESDHRYYPPLKHKYQNDWVKYLHDNDEKINNSNKELYPHPGQYSTTIGNGHLFQAQMWRDYGKKIYNNYTVHGIARTEEETHAQADKYLQYHIKKFGISHSKLKRVNDKVNGTQGTDSDIENYNHLNDYKMTTFYTTEKDSLPDSLFFLNGTVAERNIKPLIDNNGSHIGYSWKQSHNIDSDFYESESNVDHKFSKAQSDIERIHKELYDMNNQQQKIAYKLAETEEMNYEGVGSLIGQAMGPQDASANITDVEEGPKNRPRPEQSPGALQGQAVLPDLTSWYTASRSLHDKEYYHGTDDSENDDQDDYDDNYTW